LLRVLFIILSWVGSQMIPQLGCEPPSQLRTGRALPRSEGMRFPNVLIW
jgi:hypothetical protein